MYVLISIILFRIDDVNIQMLHFDMSFGYYFNFFVTDSSKQIKAESKSLSSVSIGSRKYFEPFDETKKMLNLDTELP